MGVQSSLKKTILTLLLYVFVVPKTLGEHFMKKIIVLASLLSMGNANAFLDSVLSAVVGAATETAAQTAAAE